MKDKHSVDIIIKKKDVLELGIEYEITIDNQNIKDILLNELNINDIETFVKLVDNDLNICNQEHHQNNFLDDFPVI
jgi:hypothetical protein